jgi:hypothetical protein
LPCPAQVTVKELVYFHPDISVDADPSLPVPVLHHRDNLSVPDFDLHRAAQVPLVVTQVRRACVVGV